MSLTMMFLLSACTDGASGEGVLLDIWAAPAPLMPTVLDVGWIAESAGTSWIEWGINGSLNQKTPPALTAEGEQQATLYGIKAGAVVQYRVVLETNDGERLESEINELELALAPADLPPLYVEGRWPGGYAITTIIEDQRSWTAILDGDGDPLWYLQQPSGTLVTSAELAREGGLWLMISPAHFGESDPILVRVNLRGEELERLTLSKGHHDFAELPDGRIAWLAYEQTLLDIDGVSTLITTDSVRVQSPTDGPDHIVFDYFRSYGPPQLICEHQQTESTIGGLDWTHSNSLSYNEDDSTFGVMSFHLDALLMVQDDTGQILDELGGLNGSHKMEVGAVPWSHGHTSEVNDGDMLVFDNGLHHNPPVSSVSRWSWTPGGELVQEWRHEEPQGRIVQALGDAISLPQEQVLVTWSTLGLLSLLNAEGENPWSASTAAGVGLGRALWVDNLYTDLNGY